MSKDEGTDQKVDYRQTLNLPQTDFPMRGNLPQREPERLAKWEESRLYERILETHKNDPKWVLHDGPPYANGDIHMGHALNKTLKDIVVRYRTMKGHFSKYVPGFDCHGLPIEQKALEALKGGQDRDPLEIRKVCHQYATKYIGAQTAQFKRLGVQGTWEAPYLTLDPKREADSLRLLRDLVARGFVYKGMRPVYWDTVFRTALAEAEIEYGEHTSASIFVRFPCVDWEVDRVDWVDGVDKNSRAQSDLDTSSTKSTTSTASTPNFIIWTTTPWTLPGNMAVCLHPDLDYVLAEVADGERVIVAEGLLSSFCEQTGLGEPKILAKCKGAALEGLHCAHPLLEKQSLVIVGEHVTLEHGTGCVHTAPGHGADDFYVCQKYNIETVVPVDEAGKFNELYPPLQGVNVWQANPSIIGELKTRGLLVKESKITHQYPFSWRSHKPIIFRATEQWFLRMEHNDLRQRCLDAVNNDVQWVPQWGRERIGNMIAGRPDWCLSRQRSWGIPIPSVYSLKAGKSILAVEIMDKFIEQVEQHGTDCWYSMPVEAFIPEGFVCPESGGTEFKKEFDILDVWFDSGTTHASVLEADPELVSPCDMYLEGSDQYRGWFNSSLITSVAARDRAPYKTVLTHGFLLDEKGEAMSKSKGNVISPLDIIKQMGADVLRLWVTSEDYRSDLKVSKEILERVSEAYRRMRNTFRYLLGNLSDFTEANKVSEEQMEELDRWALECLRQLVERVASAYETYELHRVYHLTHAFCVEMSAAYLDVVKDRLYCSAPNDPIRRSTQTVLHEMLSTLTRLLAPIMPFTTDEAWESAFGESESVHLSAFPDLKSVKLDSALLSRWELLGQVREVVARQLEEARRSKLIGSSLDASVTLKVHDERLYGILKEDTPLLRQIFIVSQLDVEPAEAVENAELMEQRLEAVVQVASGEKCERCWNWAPEVGKDVTHSTLCRRCADVVARLTVS